MKSKIQNTPKGIQQGIQHTPRFSPVQSAQSWVWMPVFIALFWLLSPLLWANTLTVTTDRQQIEMGDIITLQVQADFQTLSGQPDFDLLKDQFDILGTQRSNSVRMINGKFFTETFWTVRLTPKQTGELVIPPFQVEGVQSQPYKIQVSQIKATAGAVEPHFLEAEVSTSQPYVQQEVVYSLRFYHLGRLLTGNVRPPQFDQALSEPLGKQRSYQKNLNGRLYDVYEWQYVVYPQQSGSLTISAPAFSGQLNFRGRMKQINDQANALTLNVRPKPANYPDQATWLPAKKLQLTHQWQTNSPLRVGDSATLTLILEAEGLLASQLPTLGLKQQAGFHLYPDQPQTHQEQIATGAVSLKEIKIALVPTEAGEINIPKITLPWWNTQTNQLEQLAIPSKTLQVEAGFIPSSPASHPQLATATSEPLMPQVNNSGWFWPILTGLFALLWFITLDLWLQAKRALTADKTSEPIDLDNQPSPPAWTELAQICQAELTPMARYSALNQWRQTQTDIQISDLDWQTTLQPLKAHLFNQQAFDETQQQQLCEHLKQFKTAPPVNKISSKGQRLEPLYPQ